MLLQLWDVVGRVFPLWPAKQNNVAVRGGCCCFQKPHLHLDSCFLSVCMVQMLFLLKGHLLTSPAVFAWRFVLSSSMFRLSFWGIWGDVPRLCTWPSTSSAMRFITFPKQSRTACLNNLTAILQLCCCATGSLTFFSQV